MRSKRQKMAARRRFLGMEQLESRMVLDGNVNAFLTSGTLHINGDASGNAINIMQSAANSFTISSRDGTTTINGQSGPVTLDQVTNDLMIALNGGNDIMEMSGTSGSPITVDGKLYVNTGDGDDQVILNAVNALQLHVDLGSGADTADIGDTSGLSISQQAIIMGRDGADQINVANSQFHNYLTVDAGNGNDDITIQDTTVHKTSLVKAGSGSDTYHRDGNQGTIKFRSVEHLDRSVISAAPIAPTANNDTASVVRDGTTSINVASNDTAGSGSTLNLGSVVITQAPTSGTATANSDGTVSYTNTGAAATSDTFQYTIKDQDGTVSNVATVTITVNNSLTAVADTASVTEDASPNTATGNVLTNDTGAIGTATVSAVNGAAASVGTSVTGQFGTFQINSDGSYTYTLDNSNSTVNALNAGQTLTDSMGYTASAGNETSTATLTVTIQGHTDTTFNAVDDSGSVTEDASPNTATGSVLSNDTNAAGTATVTAVNSSSGNVGTAVSGQFGKFQINSDGTYTYTLDNSNATVNALSDGQTLTDSISYTASDGTTTSSATLSITIHGHTDTTFNAVDDSGSVTEDASPNTATGNVLTNDTNAAGTTSVTTVNGSSGNVGTTVSGQFGTFQINSDGSYTYTLNNSNTTVNALNNGQTLTDSMSYTASDGTTTSSASLVITIQGHTDSSFTAVNDAASVTEDASPNTTTGNVLTNDTGAAGTTSVTAVNGTAGNVGHAIAGQFGSFLINSDGTFTYTLDNSNETVNALSDGQTLVDSMSYTATDGTTTSTASLTVTVQGHTDTVFAAVDDAVSVTEDATPNTANGNVLTNDTNAAGTTSVTAVNGTAANVGTTLAGQFGIFQINSDGTFTYTLDNANATVNALSDGQTLSDAMNYTATDGTTTSSATLTVTIEGHTDTTFSAVDDAASVTEDASPNTATGNVLTNDTNAAGATSVTAVNGSAGNVGTTITGQFGTFEINSDGTYTYTLDNSNATVNALNDGQTLTDTMSYAATDGTTTSSALLTITIQGHTDTTFAAVDDAASVTEDATPNTATGNVLSNDTNATGTTSVTAVNATAGNVGATVNGQFGTFQINSDGTYTYTLDNSNATVNALDDGQTLIDTMGYTASDGTTTSSATLVVTIEGHTDPTFTAVNDTGSVNEDATPNTATGNVLTNEINAAASTSVTAVNGVAGNVGATISGQFGTFQINSDGTYTYTLDNSNATVNALNNGQTLSDTMGYTSTDGTSSSSATLTITIDGHTDSTFTAVNDAANVTEDATPNTTSGNVLTNDTNAAGTTSVTAVNGVAGNVGATISGQFGTFKINSDGSYTYTLDNSNATVNALNDGQTLSDTMDYTATDGTSTSTATLTVTISGHTDPTFTAVNDAASVTEDATPNTATGNVLTNDTNAAGTTSVTTVNGVAGNVGTIVNGQFGTFKINSDGTFTYTLDNSNATVDALNDGETLTDSMSYTATDGTTTSTATLTITINGHTDP